MLLKEIKETEFQLLLLEQNITKLDFIDYVKIEDYLDEIGKITSNYIDYMENYAKNIPKENAKEILLKKNEELLNTNIQLNIQKFQNIQKILEKYKNNENIQKICDIY